MKSLNSYLWAVLASFTWGLSYTLDEKVLGLISPLLLLVVNALVTLVIVVPVFIFSRQPFILSDLSTRSIGLVLVTSLLAVLANFFIFLGIKNLGASSAAIIEISYPFFVILFSLILLRERPTPMFLVGSAFIFFGAFIISRSH